MNVDKKRRFLLKFQWREIVALNFETDRRLLLPHVLEGTQLDSYHDNYYVTLMARNCRELQPYGGRLTLFRSVDEISIRCYVSRQVEGQVRRGFCVLRQFTSNKWAARLLRRMLRISCEYATIRRQTTDFQAAHSDSRPTAEYHWTLGKIENVLKVKARSAIRTPKEHFFLNHQFMYAESSKGTLEYPISHAPWMIWDAGSGTFDCDTEHILNEEFRRTFKGRPSSVMLCRGGDKSVFRPKLIN